MLQLIAKFNLVDKIVIFFALTCTVPIISSSLLRDYLYLSPDSFDWILEGRLILVDGVVFPILRNPGFVFLSWLDGIVGSHGVFFFLANFLGLLLQYMAIRKLAEAFEIKLLLLGVITFIYFSSFIHFISFIVLSDTLVVGITAYVLASVYSSGKLPAKKLFKLSALVTFASLCQLYALLGALPIFFRLLKENQLKKIIIFACFLFTILISVNHTYYSLINFEAKPSQLKFLRFSNDMLSFYVNTWTVLFLPIVMIVILGIFRGNNLNIKKNISHIFRDVYIIPGIFILIMSFFYQFNESRFSYIGFSLTVPIVLCKTAHIFSNSKVLEERRLFAISSLLIAITWNLFSTPAQYWEPKLNSLKFGNIWFAHSIDQLIGNHQSSPYGNWLKIIEMQCDEGVLESERIRSVSSMTTDPYTLAELQLAARYCVVK